MKREKPVYRVKPPYIPDGLEQLHLTELLERERYSQGTMTQLHFEGQSARSISFDQIVFKQVTLHNTTLPRVHLLDSRFSACDLANAEWNEANLHCVEILDSHLTGLRINESIFKDTLFKECRAPFAQFSALKCKGVRFDNCDLSEANFSEADLSGVTFRNCNLTNADFTRAKMHGADLRGSKIEGCRIGPAELQGATLDMEQALAFVRSMGITISLIDEPKAFR